MNVMREIRNLNQRELELNISGTASWHADYRDSAYIFFGGISPELSEGDCLVLFSQFGEIVDLHLPRRAGVGGALGARMGFGFLAYEDQRSTILAIDNLNGFEMTLPGETRSRFIRVDHAGKYRRPKGAAAAAGENAEQKAFADVESNDAEYDRRRKAIWDYERYATQDTGKRRALAVGEVPAFEDLAVAGAASASASSHVDPNDSREDAKHADRVLAMLAEKQRQRERARNRGDAEGTGDGARAGHAAAGGTTVGADGQRRFGDQIIAAPAAAAASSSSSSSAAAAAGSSSHSSSRSHHPSSSSSHRDRDGHRESKHRSRSRSRSRDRDRKRDRKRSRSRSKDRQRR